MIEQTAFERLKRTYLATGTIDEALYLVFAEVVRNMARPEVLPRAWSPSGKWDVEARQDALQGWIERRLLRTHALRAAFDHAAGPGAFYRSLERSFRHYLSNAAVRSELRNLLERAAEVLEAQEKFSGHDLGGHRWWGLSSWQAPEPWAGRDADLIACAWGAGDFALFRYRRSVERASPTLSTPDLIRFLANLFELCERLLDRGHLRVVFRDRFNLADTEVVHLESAPEQPATEMSGREDVLPVAASVLEEISAQQARVLELKHKQLTLDQISATLGIARGTVDNELRRIGVIVDRHRGDIPRERVLEILLDPRSIEA